MPDRSSNLNRGKGSADPLPSIKILPAAHRSKKPAAKSRHTRNSNFGGGADRVGGVSDSSVATGVAGSVATEGASGSLIDGQPDDRARCQTTQRFPKTGLVVSSQFDSGNLHKLKIKRDQLDASTGEQKCEFTAVVSLGIHTQPLPLLPPYSPGALCNAVGFFWMADRCSALS